MQSITLPKKSKFIETGESSGKFIIEDCYPGYGTTLGNSLRRVLLSSLDGSAATAIKIKGVAHEFSTIEGVKEDVTEIILNLKELCAKLHSEGSKKVIIDAKGECEIKAGDIIGFAATVVTTNFAPKSVVWSVTGKGTITQEGVLTVGADAAKADTITVTVTSTFDGTKKAQATVTIS